MSLDVKNREALTDDGVSANPFPQMHSDCVFWGLSESAMRVVVTRTVAKRGAYLSEVF
jgi:hypothetical protein